MDEKDKMIEHAKKCVKRAYIKYYGRRVSEDDIYVVWFSKTLQNWKALLATKLKDRKYFEITYDGDKNQTYVDAYTKEHNLVLKDEDL